jgi:hypothetical protein
METADAVKAEIGATVFGRIETASWVDGIVASRKSAGGDQVAGNGGGGFARSWKECLTRGGRDDSAKRLVL